MDAKPQRPMRALRVRDENAIPTSAIPSKAIHQRNKSTPALSTLLQSQPNKAAGPKRTVFADVSNTSRTLQQAKDDMVISAKGGVAVLTGKAHADNLKIPASIPTVENLKLAPLLRPAQKPSIAPLKQATSIPSAITAPLAPLSKASISDLAPEVAAARKTLAKRQTTIFKEPAPVPAPTQAPQETHSTTTSISTAPVHQVLPPRRELSASLVIPDVPENDVVEESTNVNDAGPVPLSSADVIPPIHDSLSLVHSNVHHVNILPLDFSQAQSMVGLPGQYPDPQQFVYQPAVLDIQPSNPQFLASFDQQARLSDYAIEEKVVLPGAALPGLPTPGPEEYWDDEEEEEYYETDGYTTTRSLRSRGDNTTHGMTIVFNPKVTAKVERELAAAKQHVEANTVPEDLEEEAWDPTMVAEYGDEIFAYMKELEERLLPNPHYMDNQTEVQWSMRSVLMDWLVQVHHRFNLLPETLFLCVNYVDRFLSSKVVSLGKLQLVGATAIFIAAKYEEINCPSVHDIAFMVEHGYTVEEIFKAERFMLSMLQFELGWPGPMSFLRKISKADDYDLETRTLAKYFLEITVMDERFVGCTPSFIAAGAHCLARLMLRKGDWSPAHVHYSQYTYGQLRALVATMVDCCESPRKHHAAVYDKYADKRFKRASIFVETELTHGFQLPLVSRESAASYSQQSQPWRKRYLS
ncbi:hypothetical protein K402DRAFT_415389 [Aulographum hederae CBS 113979]|uniref:Uncharacterized protein n=1 Tax=Aulographum hederae CBS 113979 TaxID=1176131 RepID=A0A6G1GKW4_9PEZI|nr:hypothetical protein K402DRAFT_415389 [Aulographum hederae CBS 113979]